MKPYEGDPRDFGRYMGLIIGGAIKSLGGKWYWTEWHVAYAQRPMDTSDNFITLQEAQAHFDKRLAECREHWGHKGAKFSEEETRTEDGGRRIRFRSIRKSGKPGTLTGLLYMHHINRG